MAEYGKLCRQNRISCIVMIFAHNFPFALEEGGRREKARHGKADKNFR